MLASTIYQENYQEIEVAPTTLESKTKLTPATEGPTFNNKISE
jgi:hypothetical protein